MSVRALYISAFLPDRNAPHAGGQAAFQNRLELQRQGYDVVSLVCTTEHAVSGTDALSVYPQNTSSLLSGWVRALLFGRAMGLVAWPFLDTRANSAFEERLRTELRSGAYALVYVDFTQVVLPVWRATQGLTLRPPTMICVHDLYIQKLLRDSGLVARCLLGGVARTERRLLQWADEVITLSGKDETLVRSLYDCARVRTRPFVAPAWVANVIRTPEHVEPHEVLFFANFSRPENAEAVSWFALNVLDPLTRKFADFRLVLGGAGSDVVPVPGDGRHVQRLGYMEDPGAAFSHCRLVVAPLSRGAGVKFKVLEALACGVPVLGTSVAIEGVPSNPLLHEAAREHFATELIALLEQ